MNNLKRTIAILCVAAAMLAAGGCGDGKNTVADDVAETSVTTTASTETSVADESSEVTEATDTVEPEVVEIVAEESDFTFEVADGKAVVTGFSGDATTVVIPAKYNECDVVAIGEGAFADSVKITKLEIPEGVTVIGSKAFYNCQGLVEVVIPNGVTEIGDLAFSVCMKLSVATVPDSVTNIGYAPFFACDDLTIKCKEGSEIAKYASDRGISVDYIAE